MFLKGGKRNKKIIFLLFLLVAVILSGCRKKEVKFFYDITEEGYRKYKITSETRLKSYEVKDSPLLTVRATAAIVEDFSPRRSNDLCNIKIVPKSGYVSMLDARKVYLSPAKPFFVTFSSRGKILRITRPEDKIFTLADVSLPDLFQLFYPQFPEKTLGLGRRWSYKRKLRGEDGTYFDLLCSYTLNDFIVYRGYRCAVLEGKLSSSLVLERKEEKESYFEGMGNSKVYFAYNEGRLIKSTVRMKIKRKKSADSVGALSPLVQESILKATFELTP